MAIAERMPAPGAEKDLSLLVQDFMELISRIPDVAKVTEQANAFIGRFPPNMALSVASALSHAYPFYVPPMDEATAGRLALNLDQLSELVMRARLTVSRSRQPNILVACAPKSASTFIAAALSRAIGVPQVTLATPTFSAASGSVLGSNLREQETDELAMMRAGLNGRGYVAQQHIRCTPYLARQMDLYRVKPIVTIRNIFDTLVSLDDMFLKWRSTLRPGNANFFDDGLPARYTEMEREERFHLLAEANCVWYIRFFLSWKRMEEAGLVRPLWVSYETDFLGDKHELGRKVAAFVGPDLCDADRVAETFADNSGGEKLRLNKGVAGRGADVPGAVRDKVRTIFSRFAGEADLTPLLGTE